MYDDDKERRAWRLSQWAEDEMEPGDFRTVVHGEEAARDARQLLAWARRNEGP